MPARVEEYGCVGVRCRCVMLAIVELRLDHLSRQNGPKARDHGPGEDVAQLADIPLPGLFPEYLQRVFGDAGARRDAPQQVPHDTVEISSFPKGRQKNINAFDTVQQIAPEPSFSNSLFEIAIRGSDELYVHLLFFVG